MSRWMAHSDRPSVLPKAAMHLNTRARITTGQSPHFLLFDKGHNQSGEEYRTIGNANVDLKCTVTAEKQGKLGLIYETVAEEQRDAFEKNKK